VVTHIKILLLICLACTIAACSKRTEDKPKTAEQTQAENAAAAKMVRDNPVYGEQIKALDKAKEMQKNMDALAAENAKKIDDVTK
jgi:mRNA-degrading endonuclease toxin of MazEF toxin-antitoxin module